MIKVKDLVVGQVLGCEKITCIKNVGATRQEVRWGRNYERVKIIFKHIETGALRAGMYRTSDTLFELQ